MMDWKREIVIAHLVRQKVAEADVQGLWPHHLPEVAASDEDIKAVESAVGYKLDAGYRDFLLCANGWRAFYQSVDVFGTTQLVDGPVHQRAKELLRSLEGLKQNCGFDAQELLPIAVSTTDIDLFAISKPGAEPTGTVLWFAGQLIDKFPNFSEWFLAMVDYNRREYQLMTNGA